MIAIKQLTNINTKIIYNCFNDAFSDYVEPMDITYDELIYMIERRGFDANLSFGAFDGDKMVGGTLNGVDYWNDELTAYDTGTGIIKEYRKQGIASKMFNESLPILKENNISQYLLEVIKSNTPAYTLYKKAGFHVIREFDYYVTTKEEIKNIEPKISSEIKIEECQYPDWNLFKTFWDFQPSWQNSINSINRKSKYFRIFTAKKNDTIVGYGIIESHTGDIPQLAVAKEFRGLGIGSKLFSILLSNSKKENIRIINPELGFESFKSFMKSKKIEPGLGQYEMILKI